jgi:ectoine hydroxylase-related dioxygenase (phytanoyl-CoA dioxygenase family)
MRGDRPKRPVGRHTSSLTRADEEAGIDTTLEALWGLSDFWYLGEQFLKQGGSARRTPWHQDTSYLRMMGSQLVACWISLDPFPKKHCLEFVRGSHRGTLYNGSAFSADDDTAPLYRHSPLPRLPDIEADRAEWDIVSWDVAPGDLIFFHLGGAARRRRHRAWHAPPDRLPALPRRRRGLRRPSARREGGF